MIGGHVGSRTSDLLDGRLDADEEHRLRTHIGGCQACAQALRSEQDARAALRAAAAALPPSGRLMAGLMSLPAGELPAARSNAGSIRPSTDRRRGAVLSTVVVTVTVASAGAIAFGVSELPTRMVADVVRQASQQPDTQLRPVLVAGGRGPHLTYQPVSTVSFP